MLTKQTIVLLFICCHFSITFAGKIADKIKARKVAARSSRKQTDNPTPATGKYEDQKVCPRYKLQFYLGNSYQFDNNYMEFLLIVL